MSVLEHTRIEELLALDALDGLEDEDRRELGALLDAHPGCTECRSIEAGFRDVAALLAASLDAEPVSPEMAERLLGVRGSEATTVAPRDELATRRTRRSLGWVAAAAAALILIAGVLSVARPRTQSAVAAWAQRVVRFDGSQGELTMVYSPGERGVTFWGHDLPDPGVDRTYEIWMIDHGTSVPGGCITPHDGSIAVHVDAEIGTSEEMAVTVEPVSCPAAPTGDPVLSANLA
jgi:anti-sigma-K factor RskA